MKYIYFASPYSHPNSEVRQKRFEVINSCVAELMLTGVVVYSPISHNHPIAVSNQLPTGWEFWNRLDEVFIHHCSSILVLQLKGWRDSVGVKAELEIAKKFGKPIYYMNYPQIFRRDCIPFPESDEDNVAGA